MILDRAETRRLLEAFDLETLFREVLGWDRHRERLTVTVDGHTYDMHAVAQKRGMVSFHLRCDTIPPYATRRQVERRVARTHHEHILIYTDRDQHRQVWQWVRREIGRPLASREHSYVVGQTGEPLIERLQRIAFSLEDEEKGLTIVDVTGRVRAAFDAEAVTKRFYDHFQTEHKRFLKFIDGLDDKVEREWYASLMLNRLMFVYFIQKRGFLDGDIDYLRNRLAMVQAERGEDEFLTFYQYFLLALFHQGLGTPASERDSGMTELLGRIPYINGGLFLPHPLELRNPDIQIPDEAFEKIFDFFDQYRWHLDERPIREADNEINPDVIGHIFEQYVNQKDLGAYYTGEDITGYIAEKTVIPFLLGRLAEVAPSALADESGGWNLLKDHPDRYIPSAVTHRNHVPLPANVAVGLDDPKKRDAWNQIAGPQWGLPNETWREVVARREHHHDICDRIAADEVRSPEQLVTLNLDGRQFLQDLIDGIDTPAEASAMWKEVTGITILDPTCGSGAFLFAALEVLDPLYESLLDRMAAFIADSRASMPEIRGILTQMARQPNRRFFILRTIVVSNLYGVDLMHEAVEIAKLRLFLKLIAQTQRFEDIRPLPDIDFNIRAGNALVGYATEEELEESAQGSLGLSDDTLLEVEIRAEEAAEAYDAYRRIQKTGESGGEAMQKAKRSLREKLEALRGQIDQYLATEYGRWDVGPGDEKFDEWRASHEPFHWFAEFYGPLSTGGFDVIIGNPPYVAYRKVKKKYTVRNFRTEPCGDLYAVVMERSLSVLRPGGHIGMIVPVSLVGAEGYQPLRDVVLEACDYNWFSTYATRPAKLFNGADKRLAIWIGRRRPTNEDLGHNTWTTRYHFWSNEEREHLFERLRYVEVPEELRVLGTIPKLGSETQRDILRRLVEQGKPLGEQGGPHEIVHTRKVRYFVQFLDRAPKIIEEDGSVRVTSELKTMGFPTPIDRDVALGAYNSSLFFWWFVSLSDARNVNKREVYAFPLDLDRVPEHRKKEVQAAAQALMQDLQDRSIMKEMNYKKYGRLQVQEFSPGDSKPLMDEIDRHVGQAVGLSDEQIDTVINYEVKYRIGPADDDVEDEDT